MGSQKLGKVTNDYEARSIDDERRFEILQKQIEAYEKEKDVLQELSLDLAAVRNKADFFRAVETAMKKLSEVKGYVVLLINDDRCTTSPFIYDSKAPFSNDPEFKKILAIHFNIQDGLQDKVLKNTAPTLFNIQKEVSRGSAPRYVSFWYSKGFNKVLGVPLRAGDKDLGIFFIATDVDNMPPLKGICAQISLALSNMIVNEQLITYKKLLEMKNAQLKEQINTLYLDPSSFEKFCEGVRYLLARSTVGYP